MKIALFGLVFTGLLLSAQGIAQPDAAAFLDPPREYRPRTWMHAMNGNLSKAGFTKDFEALAEAGLGGAIVFHIGRGIPTGPTDFGTDAFNRVLAHAAVQAKRVGIEMGLHNCDGWSSSGGPWVTPARSMKRVVWAERVIAGTGAKQTLTFPTPDMQQGFYQDIAVLAWPATADDVQLAQQPKTLSASIPGQDLSALRDGDLDNAVRVRMDEHQQPWLQASYPQPVTIRSVFTEQRSRHGQGTLYVSDDGEHFTQVGPLGQLRIGKHFWSLNRRELEGVTGRHFRVVFDREMLVRRFELSAMPRLVDWQARNAMAAEHRDPDAGFDHRQAIPHASIRVLHRGELGEKAEALSVTLPAGPWVVARYGYTSTGARNHPATEAGLGLEIDKLDPDALEQHFAEFVGKVVNEAAAIGPHALRYSEIDSYEMGGNNWTAGFDGTFQDAWGYDIVCWLPAVAGYVVDSPDVTHSVLTDFRGLIADLMTKHYYKRFTELCHEHGMKSYIEPYGFGTVDELAVGGAADKTMGEFWVDGGEFRGFYDEAVSSARIYGKNVVSAESFTAWSEVNWRGHPSFMKVYGDHAWARGINETMFHRYAHQPNTHVIPGSTMGSVGSHIDRTQTWWGNAGKAWFKYLARGSYLLQQGNPSSDVLHFIGDATPNRLPQGDRAVKLPAGYQADHVNADVLINRIQVQDGRLVLPEGTGYRVLCLNDSDRLRLKTLKRLEALIQQGAVVVGPPPSEPIGYQERLKQTDAFRAIVTKVWGDGRSPKPYGQGWVFPSTDVAPALTHLGLGPDLMIDGQGAALFTHRTIDGGELYFFYNDQDVDRTMHVSFRVGKGWRPEVWDADTGKVEAVPAFKQTQTRTEVSLVVEPRGSRFVYFRKADQPAPVYAPAKLALLKAMGAGQDPARVDSLPLDLAWRVGFDPAWGGPGEIQMNMLQDWTEHEDDGVRHFSGTAVYTSAFALPADWEPAGAPIVLDLGHVDIAAEVTINGQAFPTLWKPPFALMVESALRPGTNTIRVAVTNVWTNRLIGDEAIPRVDGYELGKPMPEWFSNNEPAPKGDRYTFTTWNFYAKENQRRLEPSGLKGPVRLVKQQSFPCPAITVDE